MGGFGMRLLRRMTVILANLLLVDQTKLSSLQPAIEFRREIPVAAGHGWWVWLGRLRAACFRRSYDGCDEAISLLGDCLYESRGLGIILQDLTQFADGTPDAVVSIQKDSRAPNPRDDLVPSDNLVPVLKEKDKEF
jgi:hypothetical protein